MSILFQSPQNPKTASVLTLGVVLASYFWDRNLENTDNLFVIALGASIFSAVVYSIEIEQYLTIFAGKRRQVLNSQYFGTERNVIYSKMYFLLAVLGFIFIEPQFIQSFTANLNWRLYLILIGLCGILGYQLFTKTTDLNRNLWLAYEWQRLVEAVEKKPEPHPDTLSFVSDVQRIAIGKDWQSLRMHLIRRRRSFKEPLAELLKHATALVNSQSLPSSDRVNAYHTAINRLEYMLFPALSIRATELLHRNKEIHRELEALPPRVEQFELIQTQIDPVVTEITQYLEEIGKIGT